MSTCTTPEYHDTHRYCPCGWHEETLRERMGRHGPLVYTSNMGADEPVFHRILENDVGDMFPVCDAGAVRFWSSMHVKHASRIGAVCDVCFPAADGQRMGKAEREVKAVLALTPEQIERLPDELHAASEVWRSAPWWRRARWRFWGLVRGLWHWKLLRDLP